MRDIDRFTKGILELAVEMDLPPYVRAFSRHRSIAPNPIVEKEYDRRQKALKLQVEREFKKLYG